MTRSATLTAVLLLLAVLSAHAEEPTLVRPSVLGDGYPLEARVSFHAALLHWMDALAGIRGRAGTAGKTDAAHRMDFQTLHGAPSARDVELLQGYADVRTRFALAAPVEEGFALTLAFFDSDDLDQALKRAGESIDETDVETLRASMTHFAERYRPIWNEGRVARRFVNGATKHPHRKALAGLLREMTRFYGVPRIDPPLPSIVVMPVPDGFGTHAQALDHALLLEVREWEDLLDEVSPIVHENAHFLFYRIPEPRREALRKHAASIGANGEAAWVLLHEALPTAMGQGVAAFRFREEWSEKMGWYHIPEIDRYAKALYPLVRRTLEKKQPFDEAFVSRAVGVYDRLVRKN